MNISKHFECAPFNIKLLGKEIQVMPSGMDMPIETSFNLHHFFNCKISAIGNINYDQGAFGRIDRVTIKFDFYIGYSYNVELDLSVVIKNEGEWLDTYILSRFFSREITDEIIKNIK